MNKYNVKLVSISDLNGAIYLVCTILVCYAYIHAYDLLPQRSERFICKNCIDIFLAFCKQNIL